MLRAAEEFDSRNKSLMLAKARENAAGWPLDECDRK